MVDWLAPISMFWVMAAVFFGGMYDVTEGSSGRQALGLVVMFALYLGLFAVLRLALGSIMPPLGSLILPVAIPTIFLGRMGKIVWGLLGVRIERAVFSESVH